MGVMSSLEKFYVNRTSERSARKFLEMVEQGVEILRGRSILELGAGTGALSHLLYRTLTPTRLVVTDYDASQVMLAESHFKSKVGDIPQNVEIRTADVLNLPFPDKSFDAVFASHVLHHVEKHQWHFQNIPKALGEVYRVLKVDGYFVYEETFNKAKIEECLGTLGFVKVLEKRRWQGNRFYVFRKNRVAN